jgi:hypothetical protein
VSCSSGVLLFCICHRIHTRQSTPTLRLRPLIIIMTSAIYTYEPYVEERAGATYVIGLALENIIYMHDRLIEPCKINQLSDTLYSKLVTWFGNREHVMMDGVTIMFEGSIPYDLLCVLTDATQVALFGVTEVATVVYATPYNSELEFAWPHVDVRFATPSHIQDGVHEKPPPPLIYINKKRVDSWAVLNAERRTDEVCRIVYNGSEYGKHCLLYALRYVSTTKLETNIISACFLLRHRSTLESLTLRDCTTPLTPAICTALHHVKTLKRLTLIGSHVTKAILEDLIVLDIDTVYMYKTHLEHLSLAAIDIDLPAKWHISHEMT